MKDVLGNELQVGDKVLAVTRAETLQKSTITYIDENPIYPEAEVTYENGRQGNRKYSNQLIKIE